MIAWCHQWNYSKSTPRIVTLFSIGPVQGKLKLTYLFMVDIAEFCFKLFPSFSTISGCVKNFYKAQECKQWQRKFSFRFREIEIFLFWLHDWPIAKAGTKKGGRNRVWQTTCGIHVDFRRNILNFQFACRFLQIASPKISSVSRALSFCHANARGAEFRIRGAIYSKFARWLP